MTVLKAVISSGGACVLLLLVDKGLWSVVLPNILAVLISFLYGKFQYDKMYYNHPERKYININLLRDFFNYSYKLYLGGIISHLNLYLMKSLLSVYLTPAKVAFYSMAQDRATLLDKIPAAVNTILYPRVSNVNQENATEYTIRAFRIILVILIFLTFALAVVIKPVVLILYGKAFTPMIIPMLIILPGILINGTTSVITQFFTGIGRSDLVMKLSLFPLFSQVLLGYFLINQFGIYGAAVSFSLAMCIFGFCQIVFFKKITNLQFNSFIPKKSDYIYIIDFFTSKIFRND